MSERAPYSRVYWDIVDDPKFRTIFDNNDHLATWLRLLMQADAQWPASSAVPATARKASVKALSDAGLIDLVTGGRFRVHGLDAERGRRREAARTGTKRDPDGGPTGTERPWNTRPKPSRDEPRQAETTRANDDGRADLEAFLVLKRRAPTTRQRQILDDVLERHDLTGPAWAADVMFKHPDDPIGAVLEADKAWRDERIAAAQAAESPKPQPRRCRGLPQSTREIMSEMAELRRKPA
jgi:hypothetical protein